MPPGGGHAFRRGAADGGDGSRDPHPAAASDDRRDVAGAGADHRVPAVPDDRCVPPAGHRGAAGRAVRRVRARGRRPRVHLRTRLHRPRGAGRGAAPRSRSHLRLVPRFRAGFDRGHRGGRQRERPSPRPRPGAHGDPLDACAGRGEAGSGGARGTRGPVRRSACARAPGGGQPHAVKLLLLMPRRLAAVIALACLFATPVRALAQVPAGIGSFVSYGYGTGVHTIAGTSAFPNFDNGAVNNHYPLAQVEQDASPSSAARATFSDSGPIAATAGSQYNQGCSAGNPPPPPSVCGNPNNGVPYADSNYPGGPSSAHVDSCGGQSSCPSARADSSAAELQAQASGFYAGGGTQPFSGASGQSETVVSSDGTLTVTTHSEVQSFVIGDVRVSKVVVDTIATATNGTATANSHVVVGSVTVNGQPVSITDQGITVQQQSVGCPSAPGGGVLPGVPGGPVPGQPITGVLP